MKQLSKPTVIFSASLLLFSCNYHKKLIKEEVVLKNKNSVTGTIISCDSTEVKLQKMEESQQTIAWADIDTIVGKRFKTLFLGFNTGFYNVPYFSVFRNENINAKALGLQFKVGKAVRGKHLNYFTFTTVPAKPYAVKKFGFGFMRYIGKASYVGNDGFLWGMEYNLMNAKYNNGVQMAIDPYWGYDKKFKDQFRVHFKMGFQLNVFSKNNDLGVNLTLGIHYMKRNFKKYYTDLNQYHRLPKN